MTERRKPGGYLLLDKKWKWSEALAFAQVLMDDQQFQLNPGSLFDLEPLIESAKESATDDVVLAAAILYLVSERCGLLENEA